MAEASAPKPLWQLLEELCARCDNHHVWQLLDHSMMSVGQLQEMCQGRDRPQKLYYRCARCYTIGEFRGERIEAI